MNATQRSTDDLQAYIDQLSDARIDQLAIAEFIMDVTLLAYELRQRRGVSQAQLAARLEKTQQAVSAFERPHADLNLMMLCKHLSALGYGLELVVTDGVHGERVGNVSLSTPVETRPAAD